MGHKLELFNVPLFYKISLSLFFFCFFSTAFTWMGSWKLKQHSQIHYFGRRSNQTDDIASKQLHQNLNPWSQCINFKMRGRKKKHTQLKILGASGPTEKKKTKKVHLNQNIDIHNHIKVKTRNIRTDMKNTNLKIMPRMSSNRSSRQRRKNPFIQPRCSILITVTILIGSHI